MDNSLLSKIVATIGDHTDDAILITEAEPLDQPGPRIVWCNAAFTRMTGYTLDDVLGKTPRILQGPDSDRATLDRLGDALRKWETTRVEVKNYTKNGTPFWVEFIVKPIADDTGHFRHWISVQRETTGRREREMLLERTTRILDTAPVGFGLIDREHCLTYTNTALENLFFPRGDAPLLPLPYSRWVERGLASGAVKEGAIDADDWLVTHARGLYSGAFRVEQTVNGVWHEFRRLVMRDGSALLLATEVESRRALQEQLDHSLKIESMGKLTGGVAHDFNNILAVVLGNLELAQEPQAAADRDIFIEEAVTAVMRGRDLTHRLLSFARRSHLEAEQVSVSSELSECAKLLTRTVPQSISIELQMNGADDTIWVDRTLFENAIINLAVNARDAMPTGGTLVLSSQTVSKEEAKQVGYAIDTLHDRFVEITVSDTGTGIPSDMLAKVIEPFFTTKPVGQGSGLGLSMVHGFVNQSGGEMKIDSEPGRGTSIRILFPTAAAQAKATAQAPAPDREARLQARTLVVDDDPSIRRYLVATLSLLGGDVEQAASGDEALTKLASNAPFDIVLTDLLMPGQAQGTDVVRYVQTHHPRTKTLLMSGNPQAGSDTVETETLQKPIQRRALVDQMRAVLST